MDYMCLDVKQEHIINIYTYYNVLLNIFIEYMH